MILNWALLLFFLTSSIWFVIMSSPLLMGFVLLMNVLLMGLILGVSSPSFWLVYVLILVLVGGLLVVFIYVTLLASNELFIEKNFWASAFISLGLVSFVYKKGFLSETFLVEEKLVTPYIEWVSSFYSAELGGLTLFLALFLFLTLIVVVTVTKNSSLALRTQG